MTTESTGAKRTKYEIRQATTSDWPGIAAFIERNYGSGAPFKMKDRWDWQFRGSPYADEQGDAVPVWIACDGDQVAGQIALQPGLLWLDGQALPLFWIVDVMVDHAHRGAGLGHLINEAIAASGRTTITLTMAPATRRMMERVGCVTLPPVRQLVRPGRLSGSTVATVVERFVDNRPKLRTAIKLFVASRIGPAVVAGALNLTARLPKPARPNDLQRVDAPDGSLVDRLGQVLAKDTGACFDRSYAFYQWRFVDDPIIDYQFAQSDRSVLVWRLPLPIELPIGTLTDILCDPNDSGAIDEAIGCAVGAMRVSCEAIIAGASDPRFIDVYQRYGFKIVRTHHPTVVSKDRAMLDRISAHKGGWHFSKADHDWDQVHPAKH